MTNYSENDEAILSRGIEAQNDELAKAKERIAELEKEISELKTRAESVTRSLWTITHECYAQLKLQVRRHPQEERRKGAQE